MEKLELTLIAEDFKGTFFTDPTNCAICKAFKRVYKGTDVIEGLYTLSAFMGRGRSVFMDDMYDDLHFREDKDLAETLADNQAIRTIILTPAAS
ncbi:hypothetical protein [Sphingobacterium mizutaii]|uniref:hypothetical protein n=1 Tax=Sphingobacterium mizutaii TaxID=1010 RepID=UPI0028A10381|nr:hypothetical protein [Sphingobacterium mizutaii]